MKKRAVMTVKWDVGAPAGFRGEAPTPCWADCPPHSMLPPHPLLVPTCPGNTGRLHGGSSHLRSSLLTSG